MSESHVYSAYGLSIELPFPCPLLSPSDSRPDVIVEDGAVPRQLDAPALRDRLWEAEPGRFLMRGGRSTGRFLVEGGTRVTLERAAAADEGRLAFRFLRPVLAAVLRHRGLLVLHGDAAATPNGAIVIAGESGAGKSTALAALVARGCSLLADDVVALRHTAGKIEVLPGAPQLSLSEDSAAAVGQDLTGLSFDQPERRKAAVPMRGRTAREPAPLGALFVLGTHAGTEVLLERLEGTEKFDAVRSSLYGPVLAVEHSDHFGLLSELVREVDAIRVERPAGRWTVDEVADALLAEVPS